MLKTSVLVCTFVAGWFAFEGSFGNQNQAGIPELNSERIALLRAIAGVSNEGQFSSSYPVDKDVPELTPERLALIREIAGVSIENHRSSINVRTQTTSNIHSPIPLKESVSDHPQSNPNYKDSYSLQIDSSDVSNVLRDMNWVFNQNPDHYTIQLALTVNRPFLLKFAEQLPSAFDVTVHPEAVNSSGNIQYSLSTGSFPTRELAQEALGHLSSDIRQYGAYARKFEEMHKSSI